MTIFDGFHAQATLHQVRRVYSLSQRERVGVRGIKSMLVREKSFTLVPKLLLGNEPKISLIPKVGEGLA